MTLKFLDAVYKKLFTDDLSYLVLTAKVLGSLIVLVYLLSKVFKAFSKTGTVFSDTDKESGLTPYDLLRPIFLILLISSSTQILSLFDSFLVMVENAAFAGITSKPTPFSPQEMGINLPLPEEDSLRAIVRTLLRILEYMNPINWFAGSLNYVLYFISYVIDSFIYPFFLAKRYFVMGLVKLFFPLMIALSIFDKTRDYMFNIMKVYARAYLSIIPMIFVVAYCDTIFTDLLNTFRNDPSLVGDAFVAINGQTIKCWVIIFIIFVKIALFKQTNQLMEKIMP